MKIRTTIAVMAAKITGHVCKLMGRQGVTWAGKVAMKICPDILEELSSQVREKIFVVCGTNGKTTTNNMLCAGLEAEGKKVICNLAPVKLLDIAGKDISGLRHRPPPKRLLPLYHKDHSART